MDTYSILPLWVVLIPFIGGIAVFFTGRRDEKLRNQVAIAVNVLTLCLTFLLFYQVQGGSVVYSIPWFLGFGLFWRVDFIGGLFSLVVALIWLLATIYAGEYMAHEHSRTRFYTFLTVTLGACLGVFGAGDLFSLFLFFELMTFSAYVLIIHEEDKAALKAGNVYLYMSILGGLALLAAVFLLQHITGATEFVPLLERIVDGGVSPWVILLFVIIGFGVKAGMLPLHIWLPRAHPVAPSPASALLSALMIKAGAYGFVRFLFTILTPLEDQSLWVYGEQFGYLFLWIGAATMSIGGVMAILSGSMKKLLAYSSISQMGYILFALGIGTFLGIRGAFGFAGAWMHMLNHALYKSFWFLLVGAVYLRTHQLDLNKLGGLRRHMPWAFMFALVAAAGITGIPGFNGYVSKVLIHEAILEAYYLHQWPSLLWLERIFKVTGGLTVAYISKLWLSIFAGKPDLQWNSVVDLSPVYKGIFGVYSILVLGIGVLAQTWVNRLVIPATANYHFYSKDIAHLTEVPFWSIKELKGPVLAYVIGLAILLLSLVLGKRIMIPKWLSVEYLFYYPIAHGGRGLIVCLGQLQMPKFKKFEIKHWSKSSSNLGTSLALPSKTSDQKIKKGSHLSKTDEEEEIFWNTQNLSFDSLLVALVIALSLLLFLSIAL